MWVLLQMGTEQGGTVPLDVPVEDDSPAEGKRPTVEVNHSPCDSQVH